MPVLFCVLCTRGGPFQHVLIIVMCGCRVGISITVKTRLSFACSNRWATALIRISRENNIIISDLSDSSTKLSMFIWAMFGVLGSSI